MYFRFAPYQQQIITMATIKLKFRKSSVEGKEGTLYYQVIHRWVVRQINSGHTLSPEQWDAQTESITKLTDEDKRLEALRRDVAADLKRLRKIADTLTKTGKDYTADTIVIQFGQCNADGGFLSFARKLVSDLERIGKISTAQSYGKTIVSLEKYLDGNDCPLDGFDGMLVSGYGEYLKSRGLCPNSVAYYMRNLRAMYNRAVEDGLTEQGFPFRHVHTVVEETVKRAVPLSVIKKIKTADLKGKKGMELARNLFLFSFYTRGMPFVDIAFLRKKDLSGGVLTYRRRKTGQRLIVRWEKCMQEIVDRYADKGSEYLLPIITSKDEDEWAQYKKAARNVNRHLRKLGAMLGLQHPMTMYVARHSWTSAAQSKSIPLSIISRSMGHDSEKTTRIYLASLDTTAIDNANRKILKSI